MMDRATAQGLEIIVIGAGVSGLSCGIRLLEQGYPVTILTRAVTPHTTSDVAGAVWLPFHAFPPERVLPWAQAASDEFYRLMADPTCGVSEITATFLNGQAQSDPWWRPGVRRFETIPLAELPAGFEQGWRVDVPLIDPPVYMPYLMTRFTRLGGIIEQRTIARLTDLYRAQRLIINCTGVWAGAIADDPGVYPIRGQIIRMRAPGLICHRSSDTGAYIYSRRHDCLLGGTVEEGNWNLEPDPATAELILARCIALEPALATAEIIEHRVGLRPGRDTVRLELEPVSDTCAVIHNYGHGGTGFTLSWGCANEVLDLATGFIHAYYRGTI